LLANATYFPLHLSHRDGPLRTTRITYTTLFRSPTPAGEDTFVRSPGGYAANVEAARSAVPEPQDATGLPPAEVRYTPDSTTIEALVAAANERYPRPERPGPPQTR